jgi:hypothetical protein
MSDIIRTYSLIELARLSIDINSKILICSSCKTNASHMITLCNGKYDCSQCLECYSSSRSRLYVYYIQQEYDIRVRTNNEYEDNVSSYYILKSLREDISRCDRDDITLSLFAKSKMNQIKLRPMFRTNVSKLLMFSDVDKPKMINRSMFNVFYDKGYYRYFYCDI